jgi:sporulation protein YlmC with PRC-barrel domain
MKTSLKAATTAVVVALTLGANASTRADDQPGKSPSGAAQDQTTVDVNKDINRNAPSDRLTTSDNRSERKTGVSDVHKASSIVGMKVKNQSDEVLGNVEDLVLDMKSGKISYAVLGVGGFLGIGEKYIAVPPSAFSMGIDEKTLVLNADKAKIQAAPGFAKTNWPDYQNPNFGAEGFWENANVGGSTGITTGTGKSGSSSDLNKKNDYKNNQPDRDLNKSNADRLNK